MLRESAIDNNGGGGGGTSNHNNGGGSGGPTTTTTSSAMMMREDVTFVFSAMYCCYNGLDMENIMLCCKGETEFLCCVNEHCCAAMHPAYGIGMVTDESKGECCKLGMFCCTCGCKKPQVFFSGASQFLCLVQVQSLPLDPYYVKDPICAFCCATCFPKFACGQPFPQCPALEEIRKVTTPASEVIVRN